MTTYDRQTKTGYEVHFGYDIVGTFPTLKEAREKYNKMESDEWDSIFIIKQVTEVTTLVHTSQVQSK